MEESKGPGRTTKCPALGDDPNQQQVPELGKRERDEKEKPEDHDPKKRQKLNPEDQEPSLQNFPHQLDSSQDGTKLELISDEEAEDQLGQLTELDDCKLIDLEYKNDEGRTKSRFDEELLVEKRK